MPFTTEEFLLLFEDYNTSVWPMQLIWYLLGLFAISYLLIKKTIKGTVVNIILALLWFWMGAVYHFLYFTSINPMAYLFGILFIMQSGIFIWAGVIGKELAYLVKFDLKGITGLLFLIFTIVLYPILSHSLGHEYPRTPTFGLPCPTTIFTFGILLFAAKKVRWYIFIIPLLWSFIGFSAAINLSMKEDYSLVIVGIIGAIFLFFSGDTEKAVKE